MIIDKKFRRAQIIQSFNMLIIDNISLKNQKTCSHPECLLYLHLCSKESLNYFIEKQIFNHSILVSKSKTLTNELSLEL